MSPTANKNQGKNTWNAKSSICIIHGICAPCARTKSVLNNVQNLLIPIVLSLHLSGNQKGYWLTRIELQEFVSCQVGKYGLHLCYWVGVLHWTEPHLKKKNLSAQQKTNSMLLPDEIKAISLSKHKEFQSKVRLIFWFRFILTNNLLDQDAEVYK